MPVSRNEIVAHLDATFDIAAFSDYAPNGLQIEGRPTVKRVVCGVSANGALLEAAVAANADMVVAHHGFFWRNEPTTLVGLRRRRVGAVLAADMSLVAYHLPLDAHPTLGNNARLLDALGVGDCRPFAQVGQLGTGPTRPLAEVVQTGIDVIGPARAVFAHGPAEVTTVAVVTGGGAHDFEAAIAAGADLFITGEPSEMAQGIAAECGANFAAFGHHATERFGPKAIAEHLAETWPELDVSFVDVPNPV